MDISWLTEKADKTLLFENIFSILSETAGVYYFLREKQTNKLYISPSVSDKYNFPAANSSRENTLQMWMDLIYPPDRPLFEKYIRNLNNDPNASSELDYRIINLKGERVWVSSRGHSIPDENGQPFMVMGSFWEIEDRYHTDELTGLLNQTQFAADFGEGFSSEQNGYILIFGLDNFRQVNEMHGHKFANRILKLFASIVEKALGKSLRVYRLEGDRFIINLSDKNAAAVNTLYTVVKKDFLEICRHQYGGLYCTISAGAAHYPEDSQDLNILQQFADNALNTAKRSGRDNLTFFSRQKYDQYMYDLQMRQTLQRCVKNNLQGFALNYQPILEVSTGLITGAEALLLWESPEYGQVSPSVFVPYLEMDGLIRQVGSWVLEEALAQCGRWREISPGFRMNINLSYIQLEKDNIVKSVLSCLRKNNLPGTALLLELTESIQLDNFTFYNETLLALNRMGVMVAIDDFGTGYSSLAYFKELNINEIKIDRCFVARVQESEYDYKLIQYISELAHSIGVTVCIEGIETVEELRALLPLSPDYIQGFYFGHAVVAADFEKRFITQWQSVLSDIKPFTEKTNHCETNSTSPFVLTGQREFKELLDRMDEVVHISDTDTKKLLYLNRFGRNSLGIQNWEGLHSSELFKNEEEKQDSTPPFAPEPDRSILRTYWNELLGGYFTMQEWLVSWNGKLVCMGTTMGITKTGDKNPSVLQQLRMEQTLTTCKRAFAETADFTYSINTVLQTVGTYYQADRAYLFEFAESGQSASNTFEWCRSGVPSEKEYFQNVDFPGNLPGWARLIESGKPFTTESLADFEAEYPEEYTAMLRYGIRHPLFVPVYAKGKLAALLGVDNPETLQDNPTLLLSLSYILGIEIGLNSGHSA